MPGGILVFFPSYDSMDTMLTRWRQTKLMEKLLALGGEALVEPKGTSGGNQKSAASARTSRGPTKEEFRGREEEESNQAAEEQQLKDMVSQLDRVLSSRRRCMVFAVFQGKISEGIDFKDTRGRVIIVTGKSHGMSRAVFSSERGAGIPFAPMKDPWVVLKRQYLDERQHAIESNAVLNAKFTANEKLNGGNWYLQSASRAVNQVSAPPCSPSVCLLTAVDSQALGRIIRHSRDWGAIFLLDERFVELSSFVELSAQKESAQVRECESIESTEQMDPSAAPAFCGYEARSPWIPVLCCTRVERSIAESLAVCFARIFSGKGVSKALVRMFVTLCPHRSGQWRGRRLLPKQRSHW